MSNVVQDLEKKGLIHPPSWLSCNTMYLTIMGSHAYGVADTSVKSKIPDFDVYGFAIPPKNLIFPHLDGHIPGFGGTPRTFEEFVNHHVFDKDALGGSGKEWDLTIYNIVKFFELCRENNPNMIDSLFTPENCVLHCTQVGQMVLDNRKLFLSKLCWKKCRGYAKEQLKKMNDKNIVAKETVEKIRELEDKNGIDHKTTIVQIEQEIANRNSVESLKNLSEEELKYYHSLYESGLKESQRFEIHKFHGFDTKFAYHILRLFDEAEQILLEGDLNLQRASDSMKAIRRGDWTAEEIRDWATEKDKALEVAYVSCKLPDRPPIGPIKQLLVNCLEHHYGSLQACVSQAGWAETALKDIDAMLGELRVKLYQ
jgi:predicted nucleotidyltransferase